MPCSALGRSGCLLRRPYAGQLHGLFAVRHLFGMLLLALRTMKNAAQSQIGAAHGTGLIHRACAGNDLTARGFGNYLSDTSPLRNDLPLAERYSDKRYKAPGPQAFGNVGGQIEPGQKTISRKPARRALLAWRAGLRENHAADFRLGCKKYFIGQLDAGELITVDGTGIDADFVALYQRL